MKLSIKNQVANGKMAKNQDNNFSSSEVERTFTAVCNWSRLSLDQRGHRNFNAKAIYATSSGSGDTSFALGRKLKDSIIGKKRISVPKKATPCLTAFADKPVFCSNSFVCSSTSASNNSGAKTLSKGEKNKSAVCPVGEINAAMATLASTTSIQKAAGYSFLSFSCMDRFTFRPSFTLNSSASFRS